MNRSWILALLLVGCSPSPGGGFSNGPGEGSAPALSASLPGPELGVTYEGRFSLEPPEPASFFLTAGELPAGLDLREDGLLRGAPSWLGDSTFEVTATLSSGTELSMQSTLTVDPGGAEVFAGFERNPWVAWSGNAYLGDLWVRMAGGGEPGQDQVVFDPGLYLAGPNGDYDGGGGDDVRVGDLTLGDDVGLGVGQWNPSVEADVISPPTWDETTGTLAAGEQAGRLSLSFSPDGYVPSATFLSVVPPDWCPQGQHDRGGPSPGVCE
ncbi:MAG: hypothetical protein KDA24_24795 [Deltaproteobacteria bacterium]|nr:hypothetical protein [Deltaproteobacteria bacterium]